jgi:amidohydrolase
VTVDPIVIGSQIVVALQTLTSREIHTREQSVVTVGVFDAGTAPNVIPDEARLRGTVRSYSPKVRRFLQQRIGDLSSGIAEAMRGNADLEWLPGYPAMVNHPLGVEIVKTAVRGLLGGEAVVEIEPIMASEDFSYVLKKVPGAMFFLGVRDKSWETPRGAHSASFDMNEDALPIGAAVLAASALEFLIAT